MRLLAACRQYKRDAKPHHPTPGKYKYKYKCKYKYKYKYKYTYKYKYKYNYKIYLQARVADVETEGSNRACCHKYILYCIYICLQAAA